MALAQGRDQQTGFDGLAQADVVGNQPVEIARTEDVMDEVYLVGKRVDVELRQSARVLVPQFQRMRERSEEHTSELQSLMRISYAVFCLKKKKTSPEQR